jgi:hypothetical protein
LKPTKEELKKLADAQKAAEKAAKDHAKTLREQVSSAVKEVESNLADAQKQLQDYANATADAVTGTVSLSDAFKTQDDAAKDVQDALKERKDAYTDVAKATKEVDDALKKLTKTQQGEDQDAITAATEDLADAKLKLAEANDALAVSETAVNTAQKVQEKSNYGQVFAKQIADAQEFAKRLDFLVRNQGLGKAGLQQLLNLGVEAGNVVAGELITGTSSTTTIQINEGLAGLSTAAGNLGLSAGNAFFGGNVAAGQNALNQAQNYQITVNAGLVSNPASVGRDIIEAIKAAERLSGQVFVSA